MERGYLKLWRKSLDSGLIKNHNVWVFWTWCLMKTNHRENYKCVVGFQEVILQPGQFIFGFKKASKQTGLTIQKIRTCLTFLKKCQNLTIKTTNKFSIISIINWTLYQQDKIINNKQSNKQVTSKQQASNNIQTHKNNKEIYSRVISYLNKKLKSHYKSTTKKTQSLIKARLSEGFTADDFKTVIDYCCGNWIGDEKMQDYLRPETLFSPKFEGYLNSAGRVKHQAPVKTIYAGVMND